MTTLSDDQAATAIKEHHGELRQGLRDRVVALREAVRAGSNEREPRQVVLAYLAAELLPHAAAEEEALYPAGDTGASALLVQAMRAEHVNLVEHVDRLREATDAVESVAAASEILALFESHLWKENELLIPALVADPDVALGDLLEGMHELVG